MEAVKHWEEAEVETEEVSLRGRLPRQHISSTATTTTTFSITTSKDDSRTSTGESSVTSTEVESFKEEKVDGSARNGISYEENGDTKSANGRSGLDDTRIALLISEENRADQILEFEANDSDFHKSITDVANHQDVEVKNQNKDLPTFSPLPSQKPPQKENGTSVPLNHGRTEYTEADLRNKTEEELRELLLERLYQRQGPSEFYCPNCKACITKVLVRERELEVRPSIPPRPDERIRCTCTSCFSFLLIPAGWFFSRWSADEEENTTDQDVPVQSDGDQNSQATTSKTPVPEKSVVASASATGKPQDINAESNGIKDPVLSRGSTETIYVQKSQAASVSITPVLGEAAGASLNVEARPLFSTTIEGLVPSNHLKKTPHDQKVPLLESVGAILTETTIPLGNNFESSVKLEVPVTSHEMNITPVLDQSSGVTVTVINTKPSTSEIDVVTVSTREPAQLQVHGGNKVDGADSGLAKERHPESTTVTIERAETPLILEERNSKTWEIVKSIVYGGLTESITSLGIVTSAASGDVSTLNIVALALANLIGGLFIVGHQLWDLKDDQSKVHLSDTNEHMDRYHVVLGKKENFVLHASVAIISFIVFGLVPPVVYGFSFRQSDDKDLKLAAIAVASLLCIILLAVGKAYTQKPSKYIKTVMYYVVIGLGVSGISYLAGQLISKLMKKLNSSESTPAIALPLPWMDTAKRAWESY